MQTTFSTPAIIAHRGDSAHAPENTLRAFRQALEKKVDGIELDVHLTADEEVVVIHDEELKRTTNGKGHVSHFTLAELRKLDAGDGEKIPTLTEVLDLLNEDTFLNIELKGTNKRLISAVAQCVLASGKKDQILYSSFNPLFLIQIKRYIPKAAVGLLIAPKVENTLTRHIFTGLIQPWSLNPHFSSITPKFMKKVKRFGYRIFTYTVNNPEDIKRILQMGVDGIFTDDPQAAQALRSELE